MVNITGEEVKYFCSMDEGLDLGTIVKGHHAQTSRFQPIQKHENISYLSLNVKGNILESTKMKESGHGYLTNILMSDIGNI